MASCNECICSEVCYYKSFNDVRVLKKRRNDVEKICKSFVHRDRVKGVEIDQFKNAPTVDAVEVVRCKDCKHGMKSHLQPRHAKNYLCRHSWEGEYHEPDHFCSYGERKAE